MTIRRRAVLSVCLFVLVWASAGMKTMAQTVVVPRVMQGAEGNFYSCYPFDVGIYNFKSMRYQQVYAAYEFTDAAGPVLITRIGFRPDGLYGWSFDEVLPNLQINLSTTTAGPDALSTTFAANVGANDTIVYSGPLHITSQFSGPDLGPMDFDIQITLTTPFLYDPSAGNLLLDIRNFGGGTLYSPFDAQSGLGDSISCVFSWGTDSVQDPVGYDGGVVNWGLITQFTLGTANDTNTETTLVPFDIKPQGCPNRWNIKSEGVLPAAILGTQDFDVTAVDPASIRLQGVAPLRYAIEDVATPYEPYTGKTNATDCTAQGPDGHKDLTLKFDTRELLAALGHEPSDGEVLTLTLTANLKEEAGGTGIQGEDVVVVLKKAGK